MLKKKIARHFGPEYQTSIVFFPSFSGFSEIGGFLFRFLASRICRLAQPNFDKFQEEKKITRAPEPTPSCDVRKDAIVPESLVAREAKLMSCYAQTPTRIRQRKSKPCLLTTDPLNIPTPVLSHDGIRL